MSSSVNPLTQQMLSNPSLKTPLTPARGTYNLVSCARLSSSVGMVPLIAFTSLISLCVPPAHPPRQTRFASQGLRVTVSESLSMPQAPTVDQGSI